MSKNILIVESDSALSQQMRAELEGRGFNVTETGDGKGAIELMRRTRPDLVVLEVDLSHGQNGYVLCGKIRKDASLRGMPVVIVGPPDGFARHRNLNNVRADEYVPKPVVMTALTAAVTRQLGTPDDAGASAPAGSEERLDLAELLSEDGDGDADAEGEAPETGEVAAEEIAVAALDAGERTSGGDPELDMLNAVFPEEDVPLSEESPIGDLVEASPFGVGEDDDGSNDRTMIGFLPPADLREDLPGQAASPAFGASGMFGPDAADLRALRTRVGELERAVQDADERAVRAEERTRELETELSSATEELEAARASSSSGSTKETFALREAANKKDKEILRLRSELNEKDNEIVELKDKALQLEQELSEASGEMARKEAQLKTLNQKTDQLQQERRRIDRELLQAKEEARTASATLVTLQAEHDDLRGQLGAAQVEGEGLRTRVGDLESQLRQARDEASELRSELNAQRESAESLRRESDGIRSELEQTQMDLDAAKNQLEAQSSAFADEAAEHRRRIAELEETGQKNEERISRFYAKIKEDEKLREKTRKALAIAAQLLEEGGGVPVDVDVDEVAEG